MSFFKKMTKEFDELKSTFGKGDEKKEHKQEGTYHGDPSQHDRQAQPYGQPPHGQGSYYSGAPPPGPPNMDASLPPGWIKQWDSNSQRWYFVEQATGRTQWEPPVHMAQNYGPPNMYSPAGGQYEQQHGVKEKKKGHGNMGAAAGGLAVGAVGGALVGHALGDDSDSDHEGQRYAAQPSGYGQQPMQQQPYSGGDPYAPPLTGDLPDETRSGSSVSSSDKEDVEEAREEYQEALRDGDHSDIEEAREDYQEEYEETYDD